MKKAISTLLFATIVFTTFQSPRAMSNAFLLSGAGVLSTLFVACSVEYERPCADLPILTHLYITATDTLYKEILEIKTDALAYQVDGVVSLSLKSTVEQIQEEIQKHGKEMSFDEVVDAINTIDI